MQPTYRYSTLAKGSEAFRLYQEWQKSGKPEDKKKLDQHMKQVEDKYRKLLNV